MASNFAKQLLKAAQTDDDDSLKRLINIINKAKDGNKDILHSLHRSGDGILHIAARFGNVKILKYLCDNFGDELDLEMTNLDGKTALHEAAQASQISTVNYLITMNVAIDPLKRADWTPLMLSCTKDNLSVVKALLKAGANLNLRNKDGWTSFHITCREGHPEIIQFLLQCDPKVGDTVSNNGRTPLHTAALHGKEEAVLILVEECGYMTDAKDSCGVTPLADALRTDHLQVAKILIEKQKGNPHSVDNLGRSILHLACQNGSLSAVSFLIHRQGTRVDKTTADGCRLTPLHLASKEGQLDVIKFLVECGADVNGTDSKGRTALKIATDGKHESCVQFLRSVGGK